MKFKTVIQFYLLIELLWSLIAADRVWGQQSMRDSIIRCWIPSLAYSAGLPGGDYAKRFGFSNLMGAEVGYKNRKNYYLSTGAYFLFGNIVREQNLFAGIENSNGFLVDGNNVPHYPQLNARGLIIPLRIGKIIQQWRLRKHNPNCGVFVEGGIVWWQHKIDIRVDSDTLPILKDPYIKGYDRFTAGIGTLQRIGYRFFSNRRLVNFYIAIESIQGFTTHRRGWNYNTGLYDRNKRRLDLLFNLQIGWTLPIYGAATEDYYFY